MKTASRVIPIRDLQMPPVTMAVPPLVDGDHLSVAEFLRRYKAMPQLKKAELIEGVVHVSSAVSIDHGGPHARFIIWLGYYWSVTPGTELLDNTTAILDLGENCPQPDGCLRILPEYGGRSRTSKNRFVEGAPELAGEIAVSSASYDLHEKHRAYQRNGVQEYLVWRVEDAVIDWFGLHGATYRPLAMRNGLLKSKVFPGLWLDAPALIQGKWARVLEVVHQGLASDEHRRFVARLVKQEKNGERGA